MKRLKILLYGDQNLNMMDGSAIWLTSVANILTADDRVDLSILLKLPIKRNHVISNINKLDEIELIDPFERFNPKYFANPLKLEVDDAGKIIESLDEEENYDLIIMRGKGITEVSLQKEYGTKVIPYITDFDHYNVSKEDELLFNGISQTCPNIFVQTNDMKYMLSQTYGLNKEKIIVLPPVVSDITRKPSFEVENFSFIYTGKFAEGWMIEELLDAYDAVREQLNSVTLNIAGDKFQGALSERKDEIIDRFNTTPGINWVGAVSRADSMELIQHSDIGYAYRSSDIDNDRSLELSTKFLEYGINGKPIIVRRTKQYESMLGKDYPLFANSLAELKEKLVLAFTNKEIYKLAAERCYSASLDYQFSNVSKAILDRLWEFNTEKQTILFAGHDFKFIKWYIEWCEKHSGYNVLIDKWTGHNAHDADRSLELLKQADIIFCEWGLGNSEFYSNNKLRGQKLYIRVHRQELETHYLDNVDYHNVTNVIAISPHIYEEFHRIKKIPRRKMKLIPNMVDVEKFNVAKNQNINYNLGMLGILPQLKRLDRAVEIIEKLWNIDQRYTLHIKSKFPQDLPWLKNRPEEMKYYNDLFEKIENAPWKDNVIFYQHGDDVADWFKNINFTLSTSDIESFHLAPMEGMASGTIPIVFNWPGANTMYPKEYIVSSVDDAVNLIVQHTETEQHILDKFRSYVQKYDKQTTINKLNQLIFQ